MTVADYRVTFNVLALFVPIRDLSFTKSKNPINYNYQLNNIDIKSVTEIRDLGVMLDSKWSFTVHIEKMVNSALKMLGFLKRNCQEFKNSNSILSLYYALIYSKLQFAAPIWSPGYAVHIERIERVQKIFLRFLSFKFNFPIENHNYSPIRRHFNLLPLNYRRSMSDLIILYKLINNFIDVPALLEKIDFYVPIRNFREQNLFEVPYRRTNLGYNSPMSRIVRSYNTYSIDGLDLHSMSLIVFKKEIKKFFGGLDV